MIYETEGVQEASSVGKDFEAGAERCSLTKFCTEQAINPPEFQTS